MPERARGGEGRPRFGGWGETSGGGAWGRGGSKKGGEASGFGAGRMRPEGAGQGERNRGGIGERLGGEGEAPKRLIDLGDSRRWELGAEPGEAKRREA